MAGDVCSRPPTIIRFHDLHISDIKWVVSEIISYQEGLALSLFLVPTGYSSFGLSVAFHFGLSCDGSSHRSFIGSHF